MKRLSKSLIALLTAVIILSSFFTAFTSNAATLVYSTEYNSGERDELCTTLDGTSAASYYTGSYSYETLSSLSSAALFTSLQTLMRSTHKYTSSYDDCHYKADRTDCENESGDVLLLYTSYSATMSQWNGWNREHVWPKSLGGDSTKGGGADLHHIRPSDQSVNSSRGNKKYGNVTNGTEKYGSNPATGYLGGTYNSTYFEPNDNVKGDVARICLYVYVRWNSQWGADALTDVFQSISVLLEWCALDPVDTWEMGRNEVVGAIQGNRNVFIDYPELAFMLFNEEVPEDMVTPSNGKTPSVDPSTTTTATAKVTTTEKPVVTTPITTPITTLPSVTPEDPTSMLLSSDSISLYRQTKIGGDTDGLRVIFVANQQHLYEAYKKLTLTITFTTPTGTRTYIGELSDTSNDFTLYRSIKALGNSYHADAGCVLFGVAIVDIPKNTVQSASIVLTDQNGMTISQGTVGFAS